MLKHALTTTLLTAGVLLSGAALAHAQGVAQQSYPPAYGTSARTRDYATNGNAPVWNYNSARMQRTEAIGDTYTSALNDLYSHGFHSVRRMSMQDGMVQAHAITPNGIPRTVEVDTGSGRISLG